MFLLAMYCLFKKRKDPPVKSRSPFLILIMLLFLGIDGVCNTLIYTNVGILHAWRVQCRLGVFTTVGFYDALYFGYYLRMWRIYKVFSLYKYNLKKQTTEMKRIILNHTTHDGEITVQEYVEDP